MQIILTNPGEAIAEFRLDGALDTMEAQNFLETVLGTVHVPGTRGVIIDATNMPYMTSTGLRAFMSIGKAIRAVGGEMVICGLGGLALEIFTSAGFNRVFPPASNIETARQCFQAGGQQ